MSSFNPSKKPDPLPPGGVPRTGYGPTPYGPQPPKAGSSTGYAPSQPVASSGYGPQNLNPPLSSGYAPSQPGLSTGYGAQKPTSSASGPSHPGSSSGYGPPNPPLSSGHAPSQPGVPTNYGPQNPISSSAYAPFHPGLSSGYGPPNPPLSSANAPSQPGSSTGYGLQKPTLSSGYAPSQPGLSTNYGPQNPISSSAYAPSQPGPSSGYGPQKPTLSSGYGPAQPTLPTGYGFVSPQQVGLSAQTGQGDWFSQAGLANALSVAAVGAMTGNTSNLSSAFESQQQKSLSWFQAQTQIFKEYFNVTHSYVLWKLLSVLLPFISPSSPGITRANSREVPQTGDNDEQTGQQGSGIGLRLSPGRRPDLYLPVMGLITFVLVHGLSKGKNFHPDNLYNIASLAIVLLALEVVLLKGASYLLNVPNWTLIDTLAVSGYKYVNLSVASLVLMLLSGRAAWIVVWVLAAATSGVAMHKGLIAAGSHAASMQHYMGTGSVRMENISSLVAGGLQFFWCWFLMPALAIAVRVAEERNMRASEPVQSTR